MNVQERFWQGAGGDSYIGRNGAELLEHRVVFWDRVLAWDEPDAPESILEYGANIGLNLRAIRMLHRNLAISPPRLMGVELNRKACEELDAAGLGFAHGSMLDHDNVLTPADMFDMTVSMGCLIHIAPDDLPMAYGALHRRTRRYVFIAEYFSPKPREIVYQGSTNLCWARDFAGEFLDAYPGQYEIGNYGFVWRRDPECSLDDLNWTILKRVTHDAA